MKSVTIAVTDSQERFLKQFALDHDAENPKNLATVNPIHVVENMQYIYTQEDCSYTDGEPCYVYNGEVYTNPIDIVCNFLECEESEIEPFDKVMNVRDLFEKHCIDVDFMHRYKYYKPVAFFFIREEAEAYREYQAHNLFHPRVYTYSPGYGNSGDFVHLRDFLMNAGQVLLSNDIISLKKAN